MTNILFASNNIADFIGSVADVSSGVYDNTRVPYAINIATNAFSRSPQFKPSQTDDTWVHLVLHYAYVTTTEGNICTLYDQNNDPVLTVRTVRTANINYIEATIYRGGVGTVINAEFSLLNNVSHNFDIKHTVSALSSLVEVYWNKILILSGSNLGPDPDPLPGTSIQLHGFANRAVNYSELFLSTTDTRNGRLNLLTPISTGNYNDWVGSIATLVDGDSSTGITTILDDQSTTINLSAYTGAVNISNVVIMTTAVKGTGAPSNLRHFIRASGIDYLGTTFPITDVVSSQITSLDTNPSTSAPWINTDIGVIEIGFRSLT